MNKDQGTAYSDFLKPGQLLVLRLRLLLTWLSLFWENFVPAIWPLAGISALFAGLALSGVFAAMSGLFHLVTLLVLGTSAIFAAYLFVRRWRLPPLASAAHRLETAGKVQHRPLTSTMDRQALGQDDAAATALWQAARRRRARDIENLRPPLPDTEMTRRDPVGLRVAVSLVLLLGLALGYQNAGERFQQAISPDLRTTPAIPENLEAWITPPDYTGLAPIYLAAQDAQGGEPVAVPVNSLLLARYAGERQPSLRIDGQSSAFEDQGGGSFKIEETLSSGQKLTFMADDSALETWPIRIVPDKAPNVQITDGPEQTVRGAFTLGIAADDDYGVRRAWVTLTPQIEGASTLLSNVVRRIDLPEPDGAPRSIEETVFRDLSDDLLAGHMVSIVVHAEDMAGNIGKSDAVQYRLPIRKFNHPVAKALSEQRGKLIDKPLANRVWVRRGIAALQINPDLYDGDFAAHMIMALARSSITDIDRPNDVMPTLAHLWAGALRVEDGQLAIAQRKLRDLQQQLSKALAEGADQDTIDRLVGELRQAMNEYLRALQQQANRNGQRPGEELMEQSTRAVEQQTLEDMLRKAQELSRAGNRDQARNMLNQLQKMLENLQAQPGTRRAGRSPANEALKELGELMERQRQLQDKTFNRDQRSRSDQRNAERNRRLRGGGQGSETFEPNQRRRGGQQQGRAPQRGSRSDKAGESVGADGDLAAQQRQLSRQLGRLMDRLGESLEEGTPEALDRAREAMRRSENALRRQNRSGALREQTRSLQNLQRGMRSVIQSLADQNGDGEQGESGQGRAGLDGEQPDPLGRSPIDSFSDNSKQVVPDAGILQKSRRILDELRKRSSEPARPSVERDYIDRLLEPF